MIRTPPSGVLVAIIVARALGAATAPAPPAGLPRPALATGTGPVTLAFCGYIGGATLDSAGAIDVDAAGNAYVAGATTSTGTTFPVTVGPDATFNGGGGWGDAYIAKVRADGSALVYAGYIGGDEGDHADGVAVDGTGAAYVAGATSSTEATFPVIVGPDLTFNGRPGRPPDVEAFIAKVSPAGTDLVYAGYVSGADFDAAAAVAVDGAGSAYLAGSTRSTETTFPATIGPSLAFNGPGGASGLSECFVAKVTPDGTRLAYAGYIGGSLWDECGDVAADAAGSGYVVGDARSTEVLSFPVTVGPDLTFNGDRDAFIAKVRVDGTGLEYAGYVGGTADEIGLGIAVDPAGSAYLTGTTASADFPALVGPDLSFNNAAEIVDAFVARVRPDGTALDYAGYVGGDSFDSGAAIAVDGSRSAYLTGATVSTEATFPVAIGPDLTFNGIADLYVAKVAPDGTGLEYAGYIGGVFREGSGDGFEGIAVDAAGNAYVAGATTSDILMGFPIRVGPDLSFNGSEDAFVAKIVETACAAPPAAILRLLATKAAADVELTWQPDPRANGSNLWYVTRKEDVPLARQATAPPAAGVVGCAAPVPAPGPACTDAGAIPRGSPAVFFYQARAFCDATSEGP